MNEIIEYLNAKKVEYKISGNEAIIKCPYCNKKKLYINLETKLFHCFYCEARNPESPFARGHFRQIQEKWGDILNLSEVKPKQIVKDPDFSDMVNRYHHQLLKNKKALKYLYKRGITKESIERFKLGFVRYLNQDWISIPAFEDGIPKLVKYRKCPPDEAPDLEKYRREYNSKSILFNQDIIDKYDEIYITEGEFCAISMIQAGYENTIGITGGAGTLKADWFDKLILKKKIILIFDADDAGQKAAKEIWATRLGVDKCYNVLLPQGYDVDKFLLEYSREDFEKLIKSATKFKVEGIYSLAEALYQLYERGMSKDEDRIPFPWESINELLGGGVKKSWLIVVGGIPGVGKCLLENSRVLLSNGNYKKIQDVREGDEVVSLNEKTWKLESRRVKKCIDSGRQQMYKLETFLGKSICVTKEHPFLTIDGWKSLEDLKVGDYIALPRKLKYFGNKRIGKEKARLLGYLLADGTLKPNTPQFSKGDQEILKDFEHCLKKVYPNALLHKQGQYSYRIPFNKITLKDIATASGFSISTVSNYKHLTNKKTLTKIQGIMKELEYSNDTSNPLSLWLRELGVNVKSKDKFVPDEIFSLCREDIREFLCALFSGDGSIYLSKKGKWKIEYCSMSKQLVVDIAHLLLRFGIICSIGSKKTNFNSIAYRLSIANSINVKRFLTKIGFIGEKKDRIRENDIDTSDSITNFDVLPPEMKEYIMKVKKEKNKTWKQLNWRSINKSSNISREASKKIAKGLEDTRLKLLSTSDVVWLKIKSITPIGENQTYDLEIEGTHNFVSEDFIVHNTSFVMQILHHFAKVYNIPSLMFCMEMPESDLALKVIQLEKDLTYNEILPSDALAYLSDMEDIPLYFGYKAQITPQLFYNTMKAARDRYGIGIAAFDNLQRMVRSDKEADFAKASGMFKDIAMELKMPFILVSQPRKINAERSITYDDLKGSGAIGADADSVILLNRKRVKESRAYSAFEEKATIIIDKSRYSPGGKVNLKFIGEKSKFIELEG